MSFLRLRFNKGMYVMLLTCFAMLSLSVLAQSGTVRGKVADDKGNPVSGATITVKGSSTSKTGSAEGTFSISAKKGDVLLFTAVGFTNKEVVVGDEPFISVVMAVDIANLGDVVVVGYGKANRKALSSAITSVKPEDMNKGAISDVGQLLQGKVPGLNISASGDPNKTAAVVLRGASTINSPNGPFYVIDGVPGADISVIAPDDIVSMDVLKDAAATAIYGNKAANGVIMVTTKRGKSGKTTTTYGGYVGMESVARKLKVMNADEIRSYVAANNSALSPANDKGVSTDWMKAVQRSNAISQNHNISISGGTEKSTYSASLNVLNKEGVLLSSKLNRVIARMAIEHHALNDKVKFTLNVANSASTSNNTPLQNVVLLQAAHYLPTVPVKNSDGSYYENLATPSYYNPVALVNHAQDNTKYNVLLGSFNTEVKLPFHLTYNINLSYQRTNTLHGEYYDSYYSTNYKGSSFYNNPDPGIGVAHTLISSTFGTNGGALRNTYESRTKNLESFLSWDRKLGDHSLNAVVGYSWQDNVVGDGFQATNTNFVSDYTGYQNLALGNYSGVTGYTVNFGSDNYSQTRFISDFARVNYSYKDKYMLQGSVRRDGSSVFGKNNQWGYFPAVGLAWRMKQEAFLSDVSFLDDLKLRASYGETGNALGFGAYTAQQLYVSSGTYYNAGSWATAIGASQGANPDLKWEKTNTKNIGLDFALFKGIISGSVELYEKITTGMIFKYTVSSSIVPGGAIWANGGKMSNKGIEITLNAAPVKTKSFSWNTTLNLASNKNLIVDLKGPAKYGASSDSILYSDPEGPGQTNSTLQILKSGKPLGQYFTLNYAGKDASGNSQFRKHDGTLTTAPAIRTDYWYAGSAQPKLLLGWNNSFRYRNFDLNMFIRGTLGMKLFNATRADLSYVSNVTSNNITPYAKDDKMTDSKNNYYSTRYIENGSYVRFDNLTLGYNVKLKSEYVHSVRVYATGNNLFVITGYKGIDPEVNMGGVSPGVDYNNFYPKTRTIMIGATVNF